ncbi:hypothetical protein D9M68_779920 [compost metagenome]
MKFKDGVVLHRNRRGCKLEANELGRLDLSPGSAIWAGAVTDVVSELPAQLMRSGLLWPEIRLPAAKEVTES